MGTITNHSQTLVRAELGGALERHYRRALDLAETELLYRRAVAIVEASLDADHPAVATDNAALAAIRQAKGEAGETEELYRRALAVFESALGADRPIRTFASKGWQRSIATNPLSPLLDAVRATRSGEARASYVL